MVRARALGAMICLLCAPLPAAPPDDYAALLALSVREDGVDYGELGRRRPALDAYVRWLETADPGATEKDCGAFWINAHNALVLRNLLDTRPRLVDLAAMGGLAARVAGRDVTLDGLAELAREAGGPLARFALFRGTRSCPPLMAVPYRGEDLAEALEQQARAYLADDTQNRLGYAQLEAELSALFLWHHADFEPLQAFLADHLPKERDAVTGQPRESAVARSLRTATWRISFRPYDRSLADANGARGGSRLLWLLLYAAAAAGLLLLGARAFRGLVRGPPLPPAPSPP